MAERKLDPSLTFIKAVQKWEAENLPPKEEQPKVEEVKPVVIKKSPTKKKVKHG
jgi:hypothetical protein